MRQPAQPLGTGWRTGVETGCGRSGRCPTQEVAKSGEKRQSTTVKLTRREGMTGNLIKSAETKEEEETTMEKNMYKW